MTAQKNTPRILRRENTAIRDRRKAKRLNDRIVFWAIELFARKTMADQRAVTFDRDPMRP
jgi:hypothetical protein